MGIITALGITGTAAKVLTNKWFYIAVLAIALYFVTRSIIKKAEQRKRDKVGTSANNVNRANLTKQDSFYQALARRIYNATKGINWSWWTNDELFESLKILNSLNDDEIKRVYNDFKKIIGAGTDTLRTYVNDEYIAPFSNESKERQIFINRLDALSLA